MDVNQKEINRNDGIHLTIYLKSKYIIRLGHKFNL